MGQPLHGRHPRLRRPAFPPRRAGRYRAARNAGAADRARLRRRLSGARLRPECCGARSRALRPAVLRAGHVRAYRPDRDGAMVPRDARPGGGDRRLRAFGGRGDLAAAGDPARWPFGLAGRLDRRGRAAGPRRGAGDRATAGKGPRSPGRRCRGGRAGRDRRAPLDPARRAGPRAVPRAAADPAHAGLHRHGGVLPSGACRRGEGLDPGADGAGICRLRLAHGAVELCCRLGRGSLRTGASPAGAACCRWERGSRCSAR